MSDRPLTITAPIYRVWASMRLKDLSEWISLWVLPDMYAGIPGKGSHPGFRMWRLSPVLSPADPAGGLQLRRPIELSVGGALKLAAAADPDPMQSRGGGGIDDDEVVGRNGRRRCRCYRRLGDWMIESAEIDYCSCYLLSMYRDCCSSSRELG